MEISRYLCAFIQYAKKHNFLSELEIKDRKKILFSLYEEKEVECFVEESYSFEHMMHVLLKKAYALKLYPLDTVDEMDAFEAKLMDILMPSPKEVKEEFKHLYENSPKQATQYLYELSKDVNYIKVNRLKENMSWTYPSRYGKLGITINLAKPEKDPRDIAKAKDLDTSSTSLFIPKCVICKENEQNYYNARMNLRIVPLTLGHEKWHFQYSPYQYYNEHAIILHDEHKPMQIKEKTFTYLIDFVDQFSEYFIGSNADLPIVGGSILNHDHFQAGKYKFPIEDAKIIDSIQKGETTISILKWPLSTIRIISKNRDEVDHYAKYYFKAWKTYANPSLSIIPSTGDTPHHTITPIVRKKKDFYELDMIFRNNRTNEQYPLGIFHPHDDVWHIKKENIGLIEAMGLAILPGRLKKELEEIREVVNYKFEPSEKLVHHFEWIDELKQKYLHISNEDIQYEVGRKFQRVLEDAGVFKQNRRGLQAFIRFVHNV
jgi:UDPglucose--hexose-1-phosphate uridylyltransferase